MSEIFKPEHIASLEWQELPEHWKAALREWPEHFKNEPFQGGLIPDR